MGLKNTPPSMFVESKIFGNFRLEFSNTLLNLGLRYGVIKLSTNYQHSWIWGRIV